MSTPALSDQALPGSDAPADAADAARPARVSDHAYREGKLRRDRWETPFLEHFRENGYLRKAAEHAGVDVKTVKRHLKEDPTFAAAVEEAREEFRDYLEYQFVRMARGEIKSGGFMALMARAKAEFPTKYNDKLQVSGAVEHQHKHAFATAEQARALLREMMLDMTDASRAMLEGGDIIDMPALPAERPSE